MSCNSIFDKYEDTKPLTDSEYIKDELKHCKACNAPKQIRVTALGKEYIMPIPCTCQRLVIDQRDKAKDELKKQKRIANIKKGIVDNNFKSMNFDASLYDNLDFAKKYVYNFKQYLLDNVGLLIMGGTGSGKTYAAACIANALADEEYTVYMANIVYITDKMTSLFSQDRLSFIEKLQRYDLLIIDDFGVSRDTDFMFEQVYNLIDTRYRCGKPIVITTNLSTADFKTDDLKYKRIFDRIKERCHPIVMNADNFRKQIANDRYKKLKNELG